MKGTKHEGNDRLDPDVRFLLANERTLLAWVRTGLTLQAAGFALLHFGDGAITTQLSGIGAIACGGVLAILGYTRFKAADSAIREHRLPNNGKGPAIQVASVVAIAILLTTVQLASLL